MHGHGCGERHGRPGGTRRSGRPRRRKERVLHTRITDSLAEDIRRVAEDLRVPVSNLVRNVLEEAFSVVERVSDDVGDLLDEVIDEAEQARERMQHFQRRRGRGPAPGREEASARRDAAEEQAEAEGSAREFPEVVAWQSVLLNREERCAVDGQRLRRGEKVFAGLGERGLTGSYLCASCMEAQQTRPGGDFS